MPSDWEPPKYEAYTQLGGGELWALHSIELARRRAVATYLRGRNIVASWGAK
jgi:hypothetical protein